MGNQKSNLMGNQKINILEDMQIFSTCTVKFYTTQNENNPKPDNTCYDLLCVVNIKMTLAEQEIIP